MARPRHAVLAALLLAACALRCARADALWEFTLEPHMLRRSVAYQARSSHNADTSLRCDTSAAC
jgi:hypothetical protein